MAVDPTLIPPVVAQNPDALVPYYFNLIAENMPWLVGLLAVCALAAMQSTGAAYMSTAGGILTRDLYKRYLNPSATHVTQKLFGRLGIAFIVVCALMVATYSRDALVLLGGLAVAFGFQMWVPLAAICYIPWITRAGATWGLAAGLLVVALTDSIGQTLFGSDAAVGPVAVDHPFRRLGNPVQRRGLHARFGADPGEPTAQPPNEVPHLLARSCTAAVRQAPARAACVDAYHRLVRIGDWARRSDWQLDLWRTFGRPASLDIWHSVDLGLADSVLALRHRAAVVSRLSDGDGDSSGKGRGSAGR